MTYAATILAPFARLIPRSRSIAGGTIAVLAAAAALRGENQGSPSGGSISGIPVSSSPANMNQGQAYVPSNVNNQVYAPQPYHNSSVSYPIPRGHDEDWKQREPFFFPPLAPVLGAPTAGYQPTPYSAPRELAPYINEPFYPQLAGRVSSGDLDRRSRQRVEAYREAKKQLEEQTAAFVESVRLLPAGTRTDRVAEFSREMTPRAQELETRADALRNELRRNGFQRLLWGSGNWNHERAWVLGEGKFARNSAESLRRERDVARAAAFFQDGLSPAQRRLTREIALELEKEIDAARSAAGAAPAPEALFFLPESSRIQLSDTLPPGLAARVEAFRTEKSALRRELREALFTLDSVSEGRRVQALTQLANEQAPRFAELEAAAEEIRLGLEGLTDPLGVDHGPQIPADVIARIQAYENNKLRVQKAVQAQFEEARQQLAPTRVSLTRKTDSAGRSALALDVGTPAPSRQKLDAVKHAVGEFNREYGPEFTALARERLAIREAVARWVETLPSSPDGSKSVDDLLRDFEQARQRQSDWHRYQAYRDAVLVPGLSPELRRVLYDFALQKLELPLPAAVIATR